MRQARPWTWQTYRRGLLVGGSLFLATLGLAYLSYLFAAPPFYPVWLPAGVGLAAFLLTPTARWPLVLVPFALAHVVAMWLYGIPWPMVIKYTAVSLSGCLLGAAMIRASVRHRSVRFCTVRQVWIFWLLGGVVAWGIASVFSLLLTTPEVEPGNYVRFLLQAWLGCCIGVLAIGSVILLWAERDLTRPHNRLLSLEGIALLAALALKAALIASAGPTNYVYLAFPILYWAALRFGPLVATLAASAIAVETLLLTLAGRGPFALGGLALNVEATALQTFLAVLLGSTLLISASTAERRIKTDALRESDERYKAFMANSSEGIWRVDVLPPMPIDLPQDEQIEYLRTHAITVEANETMARLHGLQSARELCGRPVADFVTSEQHAAVTRQLMENDFQVQFPEYPATQPGGGQLWLQGTAIGIVENGRLARVWGTLTDVTERVRHVSVLRHQSRHDALTGLPNRTRLIEALGEALAATKNEPRIPPCQGALLMLDLNRFKEINDTLGHEAGDEILRQLAERLKCLPELQKTLVARMGGDEFAVLLHRLKEPREAVELSYALLQAIREPYAVQGLQVELSASTGIAQFPMHGTDPVTLLRRAEIAMYQAKESRSAVTIYSRESDPHSPQRLAVVTELAAAIRDDHLQLHFQPKIDLTSGATAGVEALSRWQHPRHGLLPPSQFVPVVEVSDLVEPFTYWVLDQTLTQMAAWRRDGLDIKCAANVSARNLLDETFTRVVASLLEKHDVAPGSLELEITETAVMSDPERSVAVLSGLRAMGVRLAIDDFGTGNSSLTYLKRLPIQSLKIDRSFVDGMTTSDLDRIIVTSTIHLAHDLGLTVVAEGVEDAATLDALRTLGCDQAQGFHISRPLPEPAATAWLQERDRLQRAPRNVARARL